MNKISSALPSNRVASLATFIAGLAGLGTSLAGVWPNSTTNEIAQILGGVGTLAGPISHVVGSWLWDRTPAGQAQQTGIIAVPSGHSIVTTNNLEPQIFDRISNSVAATGSGTGLNLEDDTETPPDLPNTDDSSEPWWRGHPDIDPQGGIENEQFGDGPQIGELSDSSEGGSVVPLGGDAGSTQMDDLHSSELGGPPNVDYAPDHVGAPEPELEQTPEAVPGSEGSGG